MIRLICPFERCATLEMPDDTDPVELAAAMTDHLQADGCYGESMIDRLAAVRIEGDRTHVGDLRRYVDRPLIAQGGGKRHAVRPGWVSLDGRGPAVCSDSFTVTIVESLSGGPLRATAKKEPGTAQPTCVKCQHQLKRRDWEEDLGRR